MGPHIGRIPDPFERDIGEEIWEYEIEKGWDWEGVSCK